MPVDIKSSAEFGWAVGEIAFLLHWAKAAHERLARGRFESADEDGFAMALGAADDIDAIVVAVDQINISVSWGAPHGTVAGCFASESVTSGVVGDVSFSLDDQAPHGTFGRVPDEPMAQQSRRDPLSTGKEFDLWQRLQHGVV